MAKNKRFESSNSSKYHRKGKSLDIKQEGLKKKEFLVFGLRFFDRSQGQDFQDWEASEILAKALDRISGICSMTLHEAINNQIIKMYGQGLP